MRLDRPAKGFGGICPETRPENLLELVDQIKDLVMFEFGVFLAKLDRLHLVYRSVWMKVAVTSRSPNGRRGKEYGQRPR
jgi:hypothetical protein